MLVLIKYSLFNEHLLCVLYGDEELNIYIYIHIGKLRINARGNIILPLWILRGQTPAVRIDF